MNQKPFAAVLTCVLIGLCWYAAAFDGPKPAANNTARHRPQPRSPMWPAVRAAHLKEHPVCAACGQADDLNVHHIQPFHINPKVELEPTNLITLCVDGVGHTDCHLMIGHAGNFKCFNPNVVADAKHFREMLKNRICDPVKADNQSSQ